MCHKTLQLQVFFKKFPTQCQITSGVAMAFRPAKAMPGGQK